MLYQYQVNCWIHPKSGFDLSNYHKVSKKITAAMKSLFNDEDSEDYVEEAINELSRKHEGMILIPLIVDSDKPYEKNTKEIERGIKKKFPDAIIDSHHILDAVPAKRVNHWQ